MLLFKEGLSPFSSSTCDGFIFKKLASECSYVVSTSSSGKFNAHPIGLIILNVSSIILLFLNSVISFSHDS